ncbi:MAG: hypothetical protein GXP48_01305, partial [Acidobacteria bacterium]|nr:hypothetical protein [Acidobacteriota bacterium]
MSYESRGERRQLLLLPPCIDDWVPTDHPVRMVDAVVEAEVERSIDEMQQALEANENDPDYRLPEVLQDAQERKRAIQKRFHASRFTYDPHRNTLVCPHREECCRGTRGGRRVEINPHRGAIDRQRMRLRDPSSRRALAQRKSTVEPVFA